MRYRKLDKNGDYTFGQADQASEFLINSPACVAQAILTALNLHQGQWFLDLTAGMPWKTQVEGYGTQSIYDQVVKQFILGIQGVQAIISYSSSLNYTTRGLTINVNVQTIYGPALISNAFIPLVPGGYGIGAFAEIGFGGH